MSEETKRCGAEMIIALRDGTIRDQKAAIERLQTEVASVRETWQQEITIREDMFRQSQTEIERLQGIVSRCFDHIDGCSHGCCDDLREDCEAVWRIAEVGKAKGVES